MHPLSISRTISWKWIVAFLGFALTLASLSGCQTYVFQPVQKIMKTRAWILTPLPLNGEDKVTFYFEDEGLRVTINDKNVRWGTPASFVEHCKYNVINEGTNHFLYFDDLPQEPQFIDYGAVPDPNGNVGVQPYSLTRILNPPGYRRWRIVHCWDDRFFISSNDREGRNGGYQYDFWGVEL